jgi:putative transposase
MANRFDLLAEGGKPGATKLAPLLADALKRRGVVGASWYVDETYVQVQGRWCYFYRAIDRDGNLVDVWLSDTRNLAAAETFFRSAWMVTGLTLDRVTTDGHDGLPARHSERLKEDYLGSRQDG